MRGIIDIGSNTIRLSVYKAFEDGSIMQMLHKKAFVGLAGYVDDVGMLSQKGIDKAIEVLEEFRTIMEIVELPRYYVFATASLRNVVNTSEALRKIEEATGFSIRVLSGEEEAKYDFVGATYENHCDTGLLVDIGGGSTELVAFQNGVVERAVSFPCGSLNMFTKYVSKSLPTPQEIKTIRDQVTAQLDQVRLSVAKKTDICGVGGTIRATAKLNNDLLDLPRTNRVVKVKKVKEMITMFEEETKKHLLKLVQVVPERTHTIIPGMIILSTIAKYYGCKNIRVSSYGVREGYLLSQLENDEVYDEKTAL